MFAATQEREGRRGSGRHIYYIFFAYFISFQGCKTRSSTGIKPHVLLHGEGGMYVCLANKAESARVLFSREYLQLKIINKTRDQKWRRI